MTPSRQRALILVLIVLGMAVVGYFGLRSLRAFREFRGHRPPPLPPAEAMQVETDVDLIRDWMTVPFISRMYRIPARALFEALELSPRGNEEKSLTQLNEEFYPQAPGIIMEIVKATIRANQPVPTAAAPDTPLPALTPNPPVVP